MANQIEEGGQYRSLSGITSKCLSTLLVLLAVLGLAWAGDAPSYLGLALFLEQFLASFLGIALAATFLLVRARKSDPQDRVPWYDVALALAAFACAAYVAVLYPELATDLSSTAPDRLVIGGTGLFLILEATRRMYGWVLVILALVVLAYAGLANNFSGLLYSRSSSAERITTYVYFDSNGVFGIALKITATVVIAFIFFGVCLLFIGGEEFFTKFALALMGRSRGGTAKVAVVSSLLFGTVSGSAIANVIVSGSVTIRMMKRNGYPPHMAGAIEAVASTGGQITPPVMGITAFLIAENLEISYGAVALAALIPAMLYYFSLFIQVDLEAAKLNLRGLPASELPRLRETLRQGWVFLLPFVILIYLLMVENFPASVSGIAAVLSMLVVAQIFGTHRFGLRGTVDLLRRTGRAMLGIVVVCALAGIVIGALSLSGILFKMTLILSSLTFGHPIILLGIVAVICVILGMGLPSIVIYVLLSVLIAPALVEFGIPKISAHLFIYYFGMLSMITPPICLAVFAAMTISNSKLWPTGLAGMRLGIVAYIVPFVFALNPALVMEGAVSDIILAIVTCAVGVYFLSIGCAGYIFAPLSVPSRAGFIMAGLALMPAPDSTELALSNAAGLALGVALSGALWMQHKRAALSL